MPPPSTLLHPFPYSSVNLLPGPVETRADLNRAYLMSLRNPDLLQNHYLEAGLWSTQDNPQVGHGGWEAPTCQVRGQFLGHWLSAAARQAATTGDAELKAKAGSIVAELARCQQENGGEWVGSIPEKYLDWLGRGKRVWAPQYVLHKTLMGLYEAAALLQNELALDVLKKAAAWFYRWSGQFSAQRWDEMLDVETGGMQELWADLYGLTGEEQHLELMLRYEHRRLFERLLAGEDALTNQHANTTIPEAQGAARAWEVTGEAHWRQVVEAYWNQTVTRRGAYCTGGQTNGEIWSPPMQLSARLGSETQEHCVVYNMMRLSEYLYRWTGDPLYADYWERNFYNGILAQQHPDTGMVAYFLPLGPGSVKRWGSPTGHFWCCHGTLVQAQASHTRSIYYEQNGGSLVVSQYIPSQLSWTRPDGPVSVRLKQDPQTASVSRPATDRYLLHIECARPTEFDLKLRLPAWLSGEAAVSVNGGIPLLVDGKQTPFAGLHRAWQSDTVQVDLPRPLTTCSLPDEPETVAFMDGPVVLAGLLSEERTLYGVRQQAESLLTPDDERKWNGWKPGYRVQHQPRGLRFIPLYEVRDEVYTVYFPIRL